MQLVSKNEYWKNVNQLYELKILVVNVNYGWILIVWVFVVIDKCFCYENILKFVFFDFYIWFNLFLIQILFSFVRRLIMQKLEISNLNKDRIRIFKRK